MKISTTKKIAILISLLIISAGLYYAYSYLSAPEKPFKIPGKTHESTSTTINEVTAVAELCPFEGSPLKEGESLYKPVAVVFDNHLAALPHRGISDACLVFETLAEGGITRILAIYSHKKPKEVGPVRSARIYFVDLALSYNALLAHCGGSPDALSTLRKLPIDLDQIRFSEPYWRIKSRKAPHNLLGSIERMLLLAKKRGYDLKPQEKPFFEFQENTDETTPVSSITVPFSMKSYDVTWKFDSTTKTFVRYTSKGIYIDELTGKSPPVKNIAILKAEMKVRDAKGRLEISINGKGKAYFAVAGKLIRGTWQKNPREPFKFYDENGNPVAFSPGLNWIEIIPVSKNPIIK